MHTFDKFMYLFVRFTICSTKVISPHKLIYDEKVCVQRIHPFRFRPGPLRERFYLSGCFPMKCCRLTLCSAAPAASSPTVFSSHLALVLASSHQGFISRPVTGNRRALVPVYRTNLTNYRSEPVEFKSKFK